MHGHYFQVKVFHIPSLCKALHNLGRKNYLFAGSHDAAQRAAVIYSLLATCKKNNVEPSAWLTDVLTKIQDQPINKIDELLPETWKQQSPAKNNQ